MKKVIEIALSYEGWKETNGNNINPFAEYLDSVPGFYNGKKNGFAYCNIFVHYCFVKAYGVQTAKKMLFQPDYSLGAGCIYSARYFQENGRFITANPQEGDEIFFGSASNCYHTGLVIGVENGRVLTIEGNTSDSVARRSYSLGDAQIYGYGRPDWSVVGEASENGEIAINGGDNTFDGIDVSKWQGNIDWSSVKTDFAILKAGGSDSGFYKDSKFESNYEGAKKAGIPVGAYYFAGSGFLSDADGRADAKRFAEILKGKQFEMPVFVDIEMDSFAQNVSKVTDATIAFCDEMEKLGYFCGVYASEIYGFKERLDNSRLEQYVHWVANYSREPQIVYGIWQKSEKGSIDGINGAVDLDYTDKNYPEIIKNGGYNGFVKQSIDGGDIDIGSLEEDIIALPKLKIGSENKETVKAMQTLLNLRLGAKLDTDGEFGMLTKAAVMSFQSVKGLAVDGICGKQTWTKLLLQK